MNMNIELSKTSYLSIFVFFLADHHHGSQKDLNPEDLRREKQAGDLHQEEVWVDEESLRAERVMRL